MIRLRKIPSFSFSQPVEVPTITGIFHYVLLLALLSDTCTSLVIVTNIPLNDWILRYHYYSLLLPPRYLPACSNRFELCNVGDLFRDQSLAETILELNLVFLTAEVVRSDRERLGQSGRTGARSTDFQTSHLGLLRQSNRIGNSFSTHST